MTPLEHTNHLPIDFQQGCERMLTRLRTAMGRMIHGGPVEVTRAAHLQRALGVGPYLGWQVFRLATAADPFAAVPFIPKRAAMDKVLSLALEKGFTPKVVEDAETAYREFERFVAEHTGDREIFNSMIAGLGRAESEMIDLKQRKAHFKSNAQIWGVQANVWYHGMIAHPGAEPMNVDLVGVDGCAGLRQFRPVPPIVVKRRLGIRKHDRSRSYFEHEPNFRPSDEFVVLRKFCQPAPMFEEVHEEHKMYDGLRLDGVGRTADVDFFAYDMVRSIENQRQEPNWSMAAQTTCPAEVAVFDLFLPRGWSDPRSAAVNIFGNMQEPSSISVGDRRPYKMPAKEICQYLGNDLEALHCIDLPKCPEMIREIFRQQNWPEDAFDLYRCRIQYPILHSLISLIVSAKK